MGLTARRNARTARRFFSRTVIVNVWRLIAIVLLIWGEFGVYFWSLSSCRWPTTTQVRILYLHRLRLMTEVQFAVLEKPTHILLLSDTQVELPVAYKKASWAKSLHQLTYNLYLKRAWRVTMRLNPNVVFFLGDMLVDGKKMQSEQEYVAVQKNCKALPTNPVSADTKSTIIISSRSFKHPMRTSTTSPVTTM